MAGLFAPGKSFHPDLNLQVTYSKGRTFNFHSGRFRPYSKILDQRNKRLSLFGLVLSDDEKIGLTPGRYLDAHGRKSDKTSSEKHSNNEWKSAARFCHRVAAWFPDMFCNFYFVKNHKVLKNSITSEAREQNKLRFFNPCNFRNVLMQVWINLKTIKFCFQKLGTNLYRQPTYLLVEMATLGRFKQLQYWNQQIIYDLIKQNGKRENES
jgi:hypothetical protein